MIGSRLGNYEVVSRLGEGGMGTVYRARDTMLDRDVALKVLRPELARQAALVERFRAEAVALARLRHEHIAALYGLERQGDELVMVMEFVSGETLESRVAREGPMPWRETARVIRGVLEALGHAHLRGVVHRDIKPANVMVDADGIVKVMDFGIARLIGENRQTRAGVAVGTPSYMSPEQLRGEDVDGRTDLYSVGALLFELLTGRVAFQADSDYALMMQQLHEMPAPPSTLVAGVPRALDGIVARAMAKKPSQRFGTAAAFATALETITSDGAVAEPVREIVATVAARAPRDWRIYAIGICLVAAGVIGAASMRQGTVDPPLTPGRDSVVVATASGLENASLSGTPEIAVGVTSSALPEPTGVTTVPTITPGVGAPASPRVTPQLATPSPRTAVPPAQPGREPAQPVTKPAGVAATPVAAREETASPTRDEPAPPRRRATDDDAAGGTRRARELMDRCVAAIADNDGGAAARLLRGNAGGIVSAAGEGRITSASVGGVDVDAAEARVAASGPVRIVWRTAFGGNKSGTATLTASIVRGDDGWRSQGCTISADGGVR